MTRRGSEGRPTTVALPHPKMGDGPAGLPVALAYVCLASLPLPGLLDLPGSVPLALVPMLAATPVWYMAARARRMPFDPLATRAMAVVLGCAGFLIVWSLLSTFGTALPLRAGRYIATLFAGFAILLLVRGTVTRPRLGHYVDVVAVGLAATAAISLLGYRIDALHDIIFRGTDRAAGFFKNSNQFGMALSTTTPVVLALLLAERRRRPLRAVCLVMMLLGLVASGSKTNLLLAWVSTLVVLGGHAFVRYHGARRVALLVAYVLGGIAFAGLGAAALSLFNPRALGIIARFFSGEGEVDSLITRSYLWSYSINQFLADPVLGQGAGQGIDIFYREADVAHSHNVLLDYMRTLGAPGLLGVSVMIGTVVVVCLSSIGAALRRGGDVAARMTCLGLSVGCLNYVAANMSSDSFGPSTSPFFWIYAGLSFAARSGLVPHASVAPRRRRFARLAAVTDLAGPRVAGRPTA